MQKQDATSAVPIRNQPPAIVFSLQPAVLVYVYGEPRYGPVKDTRLSRLINTRVLLLRDDKGTYYLHLYNGYVQAPALNGPWTVAAQAASGRRHRRGRRTQDGLARLARGAQGSQDRRTARSRKRRSAADLRGHQAHRAHRHARRARLRANRGHPAAVREEHGCQRLSLPRQRQAVRADLGAMVRSRIDVRSLDISFPAPSCRQTSRRFPTPVRRRWSRCRYPVRRRRRKRSSPPASRIPPG